MGRQKLTEITKHQLKTLSMICDFIDKHDLSPTVKELSECLGISQSSAQEQITQLVRKKYIRKKAKKARTIVVIRRPEDK